MVLVLAAGREASVVDCTRTTRRFCPLLSVSHSILVLAYTVVTPSCDVRLISVVSLLPSLVVSLYVPSGAVILVVAPTSNVVVAAPAVLPAQVSVR